jgi:AcrR family transcriptional regulator
VNRKAESAAATRKALLDSAGALLDVGGPEAVTLREVGARVGASGSASYRHFPSKRDLLNELAVRAWDELGDVLEALTLAGDVEPRQCLRDAIVELIAIARSRPHLYRLMFTILGANPVRAAARTHDLFLSIVGEVVDREQAQCYGALIFSAAHGIAGLELSGQLAFDKWHATAEDLVDLQIGMLPGKPHR